VVECSPNGEVLGRAMGRRGEGSSCSHTRPGDCYPEASDRGQETVKVFGEGGAGKSGPTPGGARAGDDGGKRAPKAATDPANKGPKVGLMSWAWVLTPEAFECRKAGVGQTP
jgi:hypothetical protein